MKKLYDEKVRSAIDTAWMEKFYEEFVLPEFSITSRPVWGQHIKTHPDNFLHMFTVGDVSYALAFDDYPSGFSVDNDESVRSVKLPDGDEILTINTEDGAYTENITGSFMLFQIINEPAFARLLDYVQASYDQLQRKWHGESERVVAVGRDILQLAETATKNHDVGALYAVENIIDTLIHLDAQDNTVDIETLREYVKVLLDAEFGYEFHTEEDKDRLAGELYKSLSVDLQNTMHIRKYEVENLGMTERLVSAMYAKKEGEATKGISVAVVFTNESRRYPLDHFINEDLEQYFRDNSFIGKDNIEHLMPKELQGYRLVEGSVLVRDIFARELGSITF